VRVRWAVREKFPTRDMIFLYEFSYHKHIEHATMTSTMKITNSSKRAPLKIGAEATLKDGMEGTIVKLLIEEHKYNYKVA
jgi:hypothetical protein